MAIPPYPHFGPNIRSKRPTILNPEIVTDSTSTDNHVSCKSKMSTPAFFKRASSSARLRRSFLQFTIQIRIFVQKTQLVGSMTRHSVLTLQGILSEVCNEFRIMVLVPLGAPETGTAPDKVPGAPSCSGVKRRRHKRRERAAKLRGPRRRCRAKGGHRSKACSLSKCSSDSSVCGSQPRTVPLHHYAGNVSSLNSPTKCPRGSSRF